MTSAPWPLHPVPLPDETMTSWLTRAARANAAGLRPWLEADTAVAAVVRGQDLDRLATPEVLAYLASRGAVAGGAATLRAMSFGVLPARVASWLLSSGAGTKERRARWCALCLRDDAEPYFRRAWRWEWVAWCPTHGTRLRDACPGCGAVLRYPSVHWDRPLTCCGHCGVDLATPVDAPPVSAFVAETVADALRRVDRLTDDEVDALWCLQRLVRLVGWRRTRGTFELPRLLGDELELPAVPAMSPEAIAGAFTLAWRLFVAGPDVVAAVARAHQGPFNQAIQYRCPAWMLALRAPVRARLPPLTAADVTAAIEQVRAAGRPIHYDSVAKALGRDLHAITGVAAWRGLVDAAAPPAIGKRTLARAARRKGRFRVQPAWFDEMSRKVDDACRALQARDERPSRVAIAREVGVTEDVLIRFERDAQQSLVGLTAKVRAEKVRHAVAALRERVDRISTLGVARELGWDRNDIERRPALKAIVREAQVPPMTPDLVTRAVDALIARGELVTAVGVSRELGRERDPFYRHPELLAVVKDGRRRQYEGLADRIRAIVADLRQRDEPVTFRAVAAALGKDEHFFEREAQAELRPIVLSARSRE